MNELQETLIREVVENLIQVLNKQLLKIQKKHHKNPNLDDISATVSINSAAIMLGRTVASTCFCVDLDRKGAQQMFESLLPVIEHEMSLFYNQIEIKTP